MEMQGNLVEDDDWGKNVVEMPTGMAKKNKKRVQLSKYDIALFIKDMTDIHLVSAFIPVCCMGCIQWTGKRVDTYVDNTRLSFGWPFVPDSQYKQPTNHV